MTTANAENAPLPTNWGRWGKDDEAGTLNLVTDQARERAAAQVRLGRSVSLAMPVDPAPMLDSPFAPPRAASPAVQQALLYTGSPPPAMAEILVFGTHQRGMTHIDAPVHVPVDGHVYPGHPLEQAVTSTGVQYASTAMFADGVVTRGILFDLAPQGRLAEAHPVTGTDLDAAEQRAGVRLEPGDALVVRGGWPRSREYDAPLPGMTLDAIAWMHRRDVAVYAGDIGEAHPPVDSRVPMPLHQVGLARLGMPLIDVAEVDELASVCHQLGRFAFLLTIAPPRLRGATGVPVNPLAIF